MGQHSDAAPTEGIAEPVPTAMQRLLRQAVLDHARAERRRRYPPLLHVGTPGGLETTFPAEGEDPTDHGLRVEVLHAMLRRVGALDEDAPPAAATLVWLSRRGELDLQDVDAAWLGATRSAAAELGIDLPIVLVSRHAWRDPRSGTGRQWRRLRAP